MPTIHFVKKKSLNEIKLEIPWSINRASDYSKKRKHPLPDICQSPTQSQTKKKTPTSLSWKSTEAQHLTETHSKDDCSHKQNHATASVGIHHLVRKSDEPILVLVSGTREEQFAYELYNPHNDDPYNNQVWIEWLTTQQRVCIYRSEIVKHGLRARTRQKPNRFL